MTSRSTVDPRTGRPKPMPWPGLLAPTPARDVERPAALPSITGRGAPVEEEPPGARRLPLWVRIAFTRWWPPIP